MSGEHAPLQPSAASRWMQCAASVQLEAMFPEDDSEAAKEGTLAHIIAATMLTKGPQVMYAAEQTDEMLDGAELLYDDVMAVKATLNPSVSLQVEQRVDCSDIHPHCWGTPDVRLLDVALNRLYIWDYKFGHRYVDPFENWQLMAYAIGALKNYGSASWKQLQVHLRIVQPRSYHPSGPVREWIVSGEELMTVYLERMRRQAAFAMSTQSTPEAAVGPECRDCKARHTCAVLQESAYSMVDLARAGSVHMMLPDAIGRELAVLQAAHDILKARISGLEGEVLATIKSGGAVRGWMVQQGQGRQKWAKPLEEVLALGSLMGVEVAKPAAITPKQAIKAGIPEAVVAAYSETPAGELKLVRDTGAQARKVFGGAS